MKINEGFISSLFAFLGNPGQSSQSPAAKNTKLVSDVTGIGTNNSIKLLAKDMILQYPVLFSNAISMKTCKMIADSLENEYAVLIKLLINNMGSQQAGTSAIDVIKQYHQNIVKPGFDTLNDSYIERASTILSQDFDTLFEMSNLNDMSITDKSLLEANTPPKGNSPEFESNVVKKYNDDEPLIIKCDMDVANKESGRKFMFGIKTNIHLLKTDDVILNLSDVAKKSDSFLRLIKWKIGEIKFFKDFVLNLDYIKNLEKQKFDKDNYWWGVLKSQAMNRLPKSVMKKNVPMKIATLIITKEEADALKRKYSIDLFDRRKNADRIVRGLYLLTFAIVDEASELVYMYEEMSSDYKVVPFDSFKKPKKETTLEDIKSILFR